MAIGDDFTINAAKDIRHLSGGTNYTVLELHRWLGDLADDAEASDTDILDISVLTPSARSTDQIVELINGFNIDRATSQFFYDGSILQNSGDSDEKLFAGLVVVGSVFDSDTQIQIVQDGALYDGDAPFWGVELNADLPNNILLRMLVEVTVDGIDRDSKRILVTARERGSTFAEFAVTMGLGNSTAAIFGNEDLNDATADSDVADMGSIVLTEGFAQVDLNNGAGLRDYYEQWDLGTQTINDLVERAKWLSRRGTTSVIHSMDGELFRGITHQIAYDSETSGPFNEDTDERIAWGADFAYISLTDSDIPFTLGEYIEFGGPTGARGRLVGLTDPGGTTGNMVIMVDAGTVTDSDAMFGITSGAIATVSGVPANAADGGGYGALLALDDQGTTGTIWIQVEAGTAPAAGQVMFGNTSGAQAFVNGAPVTRTLSPTFIGASTGSAIIGAYGIVVPDVGDHTDADKFTDLANALQQPPNNVNFDMDGLDSDEDYVLVGPEDSDNPGTFDFLQLLLDTDLTGGTETAVVTSTAIPSDTPATGTLRITLDDGRHRRVPYTSFSASTFVIGSTDFTGINAAAEGNGVMISYIDVAADEPTESFTVVFDVPRALFCRVRDGGGTPIKTFETPATLGAGGGSATAIRTSDA